MNKNYKNCDNGHFYAATFSSCPHCSNEPEPTRESGDKSNFSSGDTDKTAMVSNSSLDSSSPNTGPSSLGASLRPTVKVGTPFDSGANNHDRTIVFSSGKNTNEKEDTLKPSPSRKLVGWLVSYTINELGIDFRLYEGQNNIGRDAKNTVRISEDPAVSSHHATILFRAGHFYIRDEMSTNPSFVNGEEVMPGNTVKLKDGDSIMVGKTVLLLRFSVLPTNS